MKIELHQTGRVAQTGITDLGSHVSAAPVTSNKLKIFTVFSE